MKKKYFINGNIVDGTGKKASVSGYTVYGKTGTVRKIKNGEYSLFDKILYLSFLSILSLKSDPR